MKKMVYALLAALILVLAILGGTACKGNAKSIVLDKEKYILYLDGAATATPVVSIASKNKDYTLTSSNSTVFSAENGVITGQKEGIATLTATGRESSATATVIVYKSSDSEIIPGEEDGKVLVLFITEISAVPSQRVYPGGYATLPTQPNEPDQVIEGWYTDEARTQIFDFSTPVTADLVLYAKWTAGDNPTYVYKTLTSGARSIGGLKYPLIAFTALTLPGTDSEGTSITCINIDAFKDYASVETVTIPASVTIIKSGAFSGCTKLKNVIFEDDSKLITIEANAFKKCSALETIVLPPKTAALGDTAFYNCSKLKSINLPAGITELTSQVFAGAGITSVDLANITKLKSKAFYGAAGLASVTNGSKLTTVEADVFSNTPWLTAEMNAASDGVAYLGTVLIACKTATFRDITVRSTTTLLANNALMNFSSIVVRINSATPPKRGYAATNTDGNASSLIHTNKVNIVVPYQYYSVYKSDISWSPCANQIYYSLTTGNAEFFVRTLGDKTCGVLNKYSGAEVEVNIASMLSSALSATAYLERIRSAAFYNLPALTKVTLPVRLGAVEGNAFNICSALNTIRLEGSFTSTDPETVLESVSAFNTLSSNLLIYLPQSRYDLYKDNTNWVSFYNKGALKPYAT